MGGQQLSGMMTKAHFGDPDAGRWCENAGISFAGLSVHPWKTMYKLKVAIVDDSKINLALMEHLLKEHDGCEVRCFSDSAEGLRWCLDHMPDLIIVDYMMPSPDGLEFIRRFREGTRDLPAIPILMTTASDLKAVRYQALEIGANDFLTKPLDTTEFHARLKNMLVLRDGQKKLSDHSAWLADAVRKATEQVMSRENEIILRLSRATDYRDPETGAHILRVAHYAKHIAANLGLLEADQELIFQAAPMHDIGKVGVPDHVLLKPGKFEPEEFELMKRHARIGYEILADSQIPVLQAGAQIALTHHEKFDGSGYPEGLGGEDIPLFGRICAVADVFDALTCQRPYKAPWETERAVALLREQAGRHFDPACVEAFLARWDEVLEIKQRIQDAPSSAKPL